MAPESSKISFQVDTLIAYKNESKHHAKRVSNMRQISRNYI